VDNVLLGDTGADNGVNQNTSGRVRDGVRGHGRVGVDVGVCGLVVKKVLFGRIRVVVVHGGVDWVVDGVDVSVSVSVSEGLAISDHVDEEETDEHGVELGSAAIQGQEEHVHVSVGRARDVHDDVSGENNVGEEEVNEGETDELRVELGSAATQGQEEHVHVSVGRARDVHDDDDGLGLGCTSPQASKAGSGGEY